MNLETIVVLTDFSAIASNGLKYAVALAELSRAQLFITHFRLNNQVSPSTADKKLQNLLSDLRKNHPLMVFDGLVEEGDVLDGLSKIVKEKKADLIVLGTKSAWFDNENMLGKLAEEVLKKSTCPVLAVPCNAVYGGLQKMIYASDLRSNDVEALKHLSRIGRYFYSEITILDICQDTKISEDELADFEIQARKTLAYPKLDFIYFNGEATHLHFEEFAKRNQIDILAISLTNKSRAGQTLLTGDPKTVNYHQHIPILAFH